MDFNKFKVETKSNSATVDLSSVTTTSKLIIPKQDLSLLNYKQVYQICSTCERGTTHHVIDNRCKCSICGRQYKLVTQEK